LCTSLGFHHFGVTDSRHVCLTHSPDSCRTTKTQCSHKAWDNG